jgi:hypothetical protein
MLRAGLTWTRKVERGEIPAALLNMAVEPLANVLSWSGWRHVEGQLTLRFRRIQVCPKD